MRWPATATSARRCPRKPTWCCINTCHIREKAAEKVYSELGRLRKMKEQRAASGRSLTIGVAGCVAQAEGEEIVRRAPAVDLVIGPQTYHRLPQALSRARSGENGRRDRLRRRGQVRAPAGTRQGSDRARAASPRFSPSRKAATSSAPSASSPIRAARRSRGRSRQIVAEAERLSAAGVREITLLGQNVNAWHGEGPDGREWGLGELLRRLSQVDGINRLRYTTSHPRDMDDAPDRGPSRPAQADALSAPAGAGGLGPDPQGDEPASHRRASICG